MTDPAWLNRHLIVLPFYLALVVSEEQYYRECQELQAPIEDQGCWIPEGSDACTTYLPKCAGAAGESFKTVIVAIRQKVQDGIVTAGLLTHEAVHVFQRYCELVGENAPSREFEAYSIQWIAQCLMWSYRDQVFPQTKE